MPRNIEKDIQEEARRRKRILKAGLELFSEQGIETVSMNAVAAAADVGPTTLFKYFQTKEKLVISISGMAWGEVWQEQISVYGVERYSELTAYEMIRNYTDVMIRLYRERPQLLRFSGNYKTFICRQHMKVEDLREHLDPLEPIRDLFHKAYLRAQEDNSIRTDVEENVLFSFVAVSMLALAERYAQGIVWTDRGEPDHSLDLQIAKNAILDWCTDGAIKNPSEGQSPTEKQERVRK